MNTENKKPYTLQEVTKKYQLDFLYGEDALTIEGFKADDENLIELIKWLKEKGAKPQDNLNIFVIKGGFMNDSYGLTGDNRYPNDLTIVSIPLSELRHFQATILARFEIGGRWFSDVVANNARREEEGE